ncbi:MAG: sialate O-acetylesterase [Pirellulaceae bacterium]
MIVVCALLSCRTACADIRVAGIFADHMVLQQGQPISIWGWADAGGAVSVSFAHQSRTTVARNDGSWSVTFDPLESSSQGRQLRIECGKQTAVINDVLVGEVYHASGQSNMAMTVGAMANEWETVKADIAAAHHSSIRFCRINDSESALPLDDLRQPANWTVCEPASVVNFSGVAFYFARHLHAELNVPIGIVDTSRGGTPIEPFIPKFAFDSHPTLQQERKLGDQEDLVGIWKLPGGVRARDANWLPGRLFHSRLAPIRRFAVRGVIWYQGESNSGVQEDPREYQHKMRAFIRGWRQAFDNERLPVYFVQLPGSGAAEGWPYLREQQRLASDLPRTGMVVTVDIDGQGIHPPNKIDVGRRLAFWALAHEHGRTIAFSGPMLDRQEIQGEQVILHFHHAENGLMVANKDGLQSPTETPNQQLAHFEMANKSGVWHAANASIHGQTVVVTCPAVTSPIAVRYAYAMTPDNCNLYNTAGLPASPFCTRPDLLTYDPRLPE